MTSEISPAIEVENLTKRFRQITALENVTFNINRGDTVALLGSNGSGKSTTFRILLNIYQPSKGSAKLLGRPATKLKGSSFEKIGFVSEGLKLPLWMRCDRYINYCSKMYREWDESLQQQLIERFQLPTGQKLKHLSRGQRMKAAVVSILPAKPSILMLDEPFSGLDVETRAQLGEVLRQLTNETGLTTLITTHDVDEVETLASHILLLNQGSLVENEPLPGFLARHRSLSIPINIEPDRERLAELGTVGERGDTYILTTPNYGQKVERDLAEILGGKHFTNHPMGLREVLASKAVSL